jgi:hypothetical protein
MSVATDAHCIQTLFEQLETCCDCCWPLPEAACEAGRRVRQQLRAAVPLGCCQPGRGSSCSAVALVGELADYDATAELRNSTARLAELALDALLAARPSAPFGEGDPYSTAGRSVTFFRRSLVLAGLKHRQKTECDVFGGV